jgi:pimeloyl-ACP methyl ester carboxylesterase
MRARWARGGDRDCRSRRAALAALLRRWETVAGIRGHARLAGDGPPIVLVHGVAVSSLYYLRLGKRLARRFKVLAPDLPGYGRSATPPRPLDVPELAKALGAWLDLAEIESAAVLGHSLGCQIAVEFALESPLRVGSLVLLAPTMDPGSPTIGGQFGRLLRDVIREPLSLNLVEARDYVRMGPRRIVSTARFALDDPVAAKLPGVSQPTLVMRGERDPIVSQEWAKRVAELLPHGRFAVVAGAPHAAHWAASDAVARMVEEFQQEVCELARPLHHRDMTDARHDDEP